VICLKKPALFTNLIVLYLISGVSIVWTQVGIEYQNRGNRYEGIRPGPVSGEDIELISARVNYQEESRQLPDLFKLKLYLQQQVKVYVIVRELDYKRYYWMDKVQPPEPWKAGFDNAFEWSTKDVFQHLSNQRMYDLGIIARLDRPEPSKIEKIAPVIFYHSRLPEIVSGYLFTFKINGNARMTFSVYPEGEKDPVFTTSYPRLTGGRSFTVLWDNVPKAPGPYKLVGKGYFLDSNHPIDQTVYFYHQPNVKNK
jgi:hypothetical protein